MGVTENRYAVAGPLSAETLNDLTIRGFRVQTHIHGRFADTCMQCVEDMAILGQHGPALLQQLREQEDRIVELQRTATGREG